MKQGMAEREQLEKAIAALDAQRVILGDEVVNTLLVAAREKLASLTMAPMATEQRKQITILFSDLSGFTQFAEQMDPEEVRDIMKTYFATITPPIVQYGGRIEKFIGDSVLAVFGLPVAQERDPEHAVRAALAMQESLRNLNIELQTRYGFGLQMRIGVNTGSVLAAFLSDDHERDFAVVGDAVNTASRLEGACPPGGVLISHTTYSNVRGVFELDILPPMQLKGKAEPLKVYLVKRVKARAFRLTTRGVEGLETRMIGREHELYQLQDALYRVISGGPLDMVTIIGEAGLGKSRLLYEFEYWYEFLPESFRVFKGRAGERLHRQPFMLLRDLFVFRFQIKDSDSTAVSREKMEQGFINFMGPDALKKAHIVGHLIGIDFSQSPHVQAIRNDARLLYDRARQNIVEFFTAIAGQHPVNLMLEDIHWADKASLDILEHVFQACVSLPILVVSLTRPVLFEERPSWGENYIRLELHPLSRETSRHLVREILRHVANIPQALEEIVISNAEGNPFYVEELIKVMIEDGVIEKGKAQWTVIPARLVELRVPATLTGVLQVRLDRLPPVEREILQRASVVGRTFWDQAVAFLNHGKGNNGHVDQVMDLNPDTLRATLATLRAKEFIYKHDPSSFNDAQEFMFKQTILRDVTYVSVLKTNRRRYHHQAAEWIIAHSAGRADEYAGLIAGHFEQAQKIDAAAQWFGRAGEQAKKSYAYEAAVKFYEKALNLLKETTEAPVAVQLLLYNGLGETWQRLANYNKAGEAYISLLVLAELSGSPLQQANAWHGMFELQELQGDYLSALRSAERVEALVLSSDPVDKEQLARALVNKGWVLWRLGDMKQALQLGEKSLTLATETAVEEAQSLSYNLMGAVHHSLGRYQEAIIYQEESLLIDRRMGNRRQIAVRLSNIGEATRLQGNYAKAAELYREAIDQALEIGDQDGEIRYLINLSGALVGLGAFETAISQLQDVIDRAGDSGTVLDEAYQFMAEAYIGLGQLDRALAAAQWALAIGETSADPLGIGSGWRVLGEVAAQLEEPVSTMHSVDKVTAPYCFEQAINAFSGAGMDREWAWTLRKWARYTLADGDAAPGWKMWWEARAIFDALGLNLQVAAMDAEQADAEPDAEPDDG